MDKKKRLAGKGTLAPVGTFGTVLLVEVKVLKKYNYLYF